MNAICMNEFSKNSSSEIFGPFVFSRFYLLALNLELHQLVDKVVQLVVDLKVKFVIQKSCMLLSLL